MVFLFLTVIAIHVRNNYCTTKYMGFKKYTWFFKNAWEVLLTDTIFKLMKKNRPLLRHFIDTEINQILRKVKRSQHNIIGLWTFTTESDHMSYDSQLFQEVQSLCKSTEKNLEFSQINLPFDLLRHNLVHVCTSRATGSMTGIFRTENARKCNEALIYSVFTGLDTESHKLCSFPK